MKSFFSNNFSYFTKLLIKYINFDTSIMSFFRNKENTLYDYIPPADFLLSLLWLRF